MTLSKAIDRRTFLRGVDASTAVLPFVPAQLTSAAEMAAPRRVVFWWTAQGIFHPEFTPDGADSAFTLRRVLAPLAKYKDLLLLPKRLDCNAYFAKPINNDHEPAAYTLTGAEVETNGSGSTFALGPSIDQYLAQRLGRQRSQDGLILGVQSYWAEMREVFWRKARESVTGENNPSTAFNRVLGAPAAPGGADPAEALRADRKSVIDNVRLELEGLRRRLAVDDRAKLDAHLLVCRFPPPYSRCGAPCRSHAGARQMTGTERRPVPPTLLGTPRIPATTTHVSDWHALCFAPRVPPCVSRISYQTSEAIASMRIDA